MSVAPMVALPSLLLAPWENFGLPPSFLRTQSPHLFLLPWASKRRKNRAQQCAEGAPASPTWSVSSHWYLMPFRPQLDFLSCKYCGHFLSTYKTLLTFGASSSDTAFLSKRTILSSTGRASRFLLSWIRLKHRFWVSGSSVPSAVSLLPRRDPHNLPLSPFLCFFPSFS